MRTHRFILACGSAAALLALALSHAPALAGWSADPVRVYKTGSPIWPIKACSDGQNGAFVVWQEEAFATPLVLRAQHLLGSGDLDAAWPEDGVVVCNIDTVRTGLFVLSDHLGGAYVLWKEGSSFFAKRILGNGATAAGWPARGRLLGTIFDTPSVIEDGGTGFFAVWVNSFGGLVGIHLGPENDGAGGWPDGTRAIGSATDQPSYVMWPRISLAPDGGLFMVYGHWSVSAHSESGPGAYRLRRLTSAGLAANGWGAGFDLGSWDRAFIRGGVSGIDALCSDSRGGVFMLIGGMEPPIAPGYPVPLDFQLFRRQGDGQTTLDWPDSGRVIATSEYVDVGSGGSAGLAGDGRDGVYVGVLATYADAGSFLIYHDYTAGGLWNSAGGGATAIPYEDVATLPLDTGGLFLASVKTSGPSNYWDSGAAIEVARAPASFGFDWWGEGRNSPWRNCFGGVALAPTDDGGAMFFWSQIVDRFGLFVRRFSPTGEITAVDLQTAGTPHLVQLRFFRGSGIHASFSSPDRASARFELFDVAGRRLASQRFTFTRGANDVTLPGTASLPAGMFFARVIANDHSFTGKVVVTP